MKQGTNSETFTVTEQSSGPSSPHWLSRFIWDWEPVGEEYYAYDAEVDRKILAPGEAFWVRTYRDDVKLIIPYESPPVSSDYDLSSNSKGIPMNSSRAENMDLPKPPVPPAVTRDSEFTVSVSPNPVSDNAAVNFLVTGDSIENFTVDLFTTSGKRVDSSRQVIGRSYTWKPEPNLPNGIYLYRVTAKRRKDAAPLTRTGKLLVLK